MRFYIFTYLHVYIFTDTHIHRFTYAHSYICSRVRIYAYTYIHTQKLSKVQGSSTTEWRAGRLDLTMVVTGMALKWSWPGIGHPSRHWGPKKNILNVTVGLDHPKVWFSQPKVHRPWEVPIVVQPFFVVAQSRHLSPERTRKHMVWTHGNLNCNMFGKSGKPKTINLQSNTWFTPSIFAKKRSF